MRLNSTMKSFLVLFLFSRVSIGAIAPPAAQVKACDNFNRRIQAFVGESANHQGFVYYKGGFFNAKNLLDPKSKESIQLLSDPDFQVQMQVVIQKSDLVNIPLGIGPFTLFREAFLDKACVYFGDASTVTKDAESVIRVLPMFKSNRKISLRIHLKNVYFPERLVKETLLFTANTLELDQPLELSNAKDTANAFARELSTYQPTSASLSHSEPVEQIEASFFSLRLKPKYSVEAELIRHSFDRANQKIHVSAKLKDLNSKDSRVENAVDHLTFSYAGLAFCFEQANLLRTKWTTVCSNEGSDVRAVSIPLGETREFQISAPLNLSAYLKARNFRVVLYSSTDNLSRCDVEKKSGQDSCIFVEKNVNP